MQIFNNFTDIMELLEIILCHNVYEMATFYF